jgi:hypothetical protein
MTNNAQPALSIQVSFAEIYHSLCPSCRDALLDLLATKAGRGFLRDTLRSQFDAAPPSPFPLPPSAHGDPVEP